jgi:predicted alpha/beta hydrolase
VVVASRKPRHQVDVGEHKLDQLADLAAKQLADALLDVGQALPQPDRQAVGHSSGASTIGS